MVHRYNVDTQIQLFPTPWAIVTFTVGLAHAQPNYILCQNCLIANVLGHTNCWNWFVAWGWGEDKSP